jgi:hypothetical protein
MAEPGNTAITLLPLTALASDEPIYRLLSFSQWLISVRLNREIFPNSIFIYSLNSTQT